MGHDHGIVALLQPRLHLGLILEHVQAYPAHKLPVVLAMLGGWVVGGSGPAVEAYQE